MNIFRYTSRGLECEVKAVCLNEVEIARKCGMSRLLKRHTRAWDRRWQYSDIGIEGNLAAQKALRLDLYHLLIAAPPQDLDVSIAAKALSGEWYKGHVFWDTEIYMLPFFVYTQPDVARDLLAYRYRRLKQARESAREHRIIKVPYGHGNRLPVVRRRLPGPGLTLTAR
jgi:kojibiose phosphorylase